ncbi:ParB/RepB/Spo0J family partition protein [Streptomyces shaanxiensis]|uniref:ParB N-terminal domain-containing protein n=1 Tax=Streptomyces shaanxiensis TaxID=653357 RepID=A0ABP7VQ19_9ACTN
MGKALIERTEMWVRRGSTNDGIVDIDIRSLSAEGSPRNDGEDPDHVAALAELDGPLPPIIVHRASMRVIDGLHRLRAAQLRGHSTIAVTFYDGTEADAFVLAVESNVRHGLPLSLPDRKRAAARIIATHPQWSDRKIASVTGIAPGTVADVRRSATVGAPGDVARIGRDGRVRPVDIAEGRRRAGELITENPNLSLRQIARAAGISPETARDVRNRLGRGEEPLLPPRPRGVRPRPREEILKVVPRTGYGEDRHDTAAGSAFTEGLSAVNRLKADPALRLNETGRQLLRLLSVHMLPPDEWEGIVDTVPPYWSGTVAHLARECAHIWEEVAARVEKNTAQGNDSSASPADSSACPTV